MAAARSASLGEALFPRTTAWHTVLLVLGLSLVIGLASQLAIQLPFSPVPVTAQTFAVLLAGALVGPRLGALAVLAFLAEGVLGLPVFANWSSAWTPSRLGVPVIVGPTAGYLVGFVPAVILVGWLTERGWGRRPWSAGLAMVAGNLVIYAFGLAWLARFVPANTLVAVGLTPFLIGDAVKIVLAALLLPAGWSLLDRAPVTWRTRGRSI